MESQSDGIAASHCISLLLSSGEEIDTTRRGKPAVFRFGDGNLLPGFEEALLGMVPGDDSAIDDSCKGCVWSAKSGECSSDA